MDLRIALFVLVLGFISCAKEPTSCFTAPSSATTGSSVAVDAGCSENAHHVEWDFGDGGTATGSTATHIYNSAGTYTIKCTAHPKRGHKSHETTKTITIN